MKELVIEHYKMLKEEHRQYVFQIQQYWLFKLTTFGAVIATAIFNDKIINNDKIEADAIIITGLFALPVLAFLIDLKTLEVSLHSKLISDHIKDYFKDNPEIFNWESKLWSGSQISSLRSLLTILTAIGVSIAVLIISFLIIYNVKPMWGVFLIVAGASMILVALFISIRIIPKLIK